MSGKRPIIKPKITAKFDIVAFRGKPETISKHLAIDPDEAWAKGDIIPDTGKNGSLEPRRRKYSCWTLRASLKKYSYDFEDYANDLINRITPARARIKTIVAPKIFLRGRIEIYDLRASMPSIGLTPDTMHFLSDIKAELDLDIALVINPDDAYEYAKWAKS